MRRRLLLVSAPVLYGQSWWKDAFGNKPHLSSLAGFVRDLAETRVLELDLIAGAPLGPLLAELDEALAEAPALVGISCWTSLQYLGALAVAARVRQVSPETPVVIGGHHATAAPGDFDHASCDFLVVGDGEVPLRRLCSDWPARPPAMQIIAGGVFDQSDPSHIDWASYPPPNAEGTLWIGTSRGCAFKCRFCVEPERGASYSRYEVEAQLDIVERLVATHAPRVIAFSDPLFGAKRKWLEAFLTGIEKRALPTLFWCETRIDLTTPELLEQFRRCRFMVDFGLDTASEAMVARMDKAPHPGRYLASARDNLLAANAIGLHHSVYLLFNYPGETPETVSETQDFIDSLDGGVGSMSGWLSCGSFFILPGTRSFQRMAEDATEHGTVIAHPRWWSEPRHHYPLATDVLPSAAWIGREYELHDFRLWNERVNRRWTQRYPGAVVQFRREFFGR